MILENKKHLIKRLLVVSIVVFLFMIFNLFFVNPNQRSCLGNPLVLPFVFLGLPFLLILGILDILFLIIIKKINWIKVFINIAIAAAMTCSIYLL